MRLFAEQFVRSSTHRQHVYAGPVTKPGTACLTGRTQAWRLCSGSGLRKPSAFAERGVPGQWQKWRENEDRRGRLSIRTIFLGKRERFFSTAVESIADHWVAAPRLLCAEAQARGGRVVAYFSVRGPVTARVPSLPSNGV
jgi:hypothetical protein